MKKKCKHDKCLRDVEELSNGYCDNCIQLNTKECNMCLTKDRALLLEVLAQKTRGGGDKMFWAGLITGAIVTTIFVVALMWMGGLI